MQDLYQLGRYRLTAMLINLPYSSFKSYCSNTKLYIILIYPHVDCLKALNQMQQIKQPMHIILQLYTLLSFKYTTFSPCAINRPWGCQNASYADFCTPCFSKTTLYKLQNNARLIVMG